MSWFVDLRPGVLGTVLGEEWRISSEHHPGAGTVARQFGSWPGALEAAGVCPRVLRSARWDRAWIIESVRRFHEENGRRPRGGDFAVSDEHFPELSPIACPKRGAHILRIVSAASDQR